MQASEATQPGKSETRPSQRPTVVLNCPYFGRSVTALVPFHLDFRQAPDGAEAKNYKLAVTTSNNPLPVFTKQIRPTEPISSFRLALNSHRLPNGPATIALSLFDENGQAVWQESVPLRIANVGTLAETVGASLRRFNTPTIVDGACDS